METKQMETNIQNFYKNKVVFLTGGTGFLGKVFIEKLLRSTDVAKVYVLTRPKAGVDINERFSKILKDPLFEKLCTIKPNPMKYIKPIAGDCTLSNLGISSAEDREELIENVDIVVHVAATVRFNEPLSNATKINVQATVELINLAKEMKKLKSFVHVSSAFANCLVFNASETYYTEYLGISSDKLLQIKDVLGDETLDRMEGELVGKFPNTYCYTKSLAEEAVLTKANNLPICIFRPGIILPTSDEPLTGWIDNLYGPMSVLYGSAYGVLRVMYGCPTNKAGLVPVDYCANMMLACGWYTATAVKQIPSKDPPIYSLVPDETNLLEWGAYKKYVEVHGVQIPLSTMIWYPFLIFASNVWYYKFLCFVYHTVPGYIIDFLLLVIGKKPRMTKAYKKIHMQCGLLRYFLDNEFTFDTTNAKQLWKSMSVDDQKLFKFDMRSLNWSNYFYNSLFGLRKFLAKDEPDTIPKAKKLLRRLYFAHCTVQTLVCVGVLWLLWIILKLIFLS
ncbi:putative fatty acyl-CoA reductase [Lucilia cuprina]|uniref:Fatty acyl-CoA reductase n=1 Tax=Lucilia cuprina TaxID=7375 RepID=A0A0L0C0L6_LUCCU|nr:Fatty acyl-CoA reductase wat [Lucilia cuprina]KNC24974.1 putative fatty acyl-CoA reductase [Lucilia cuprina]